MHNVFIPMTQITTHLIHYDWPLSSLFKNIKNRKQNENTHTHICGLLEFRIKFASQFCVQEMMVMAYEHLSSFESDNFEG